MVAEEPGGRLQPAPDRKDERSDCFVWLKLTLRFVGIHIIGLV